MTSGLIQNKVQTPVSLTCGMILEQLVWMQTVLPYPRRCSEFLEDYSVQGTVLDILQYTGYPHTRTSCLLSYRKFEFLAGYSCRWITYLLLVEYLIHNKIFGYAVFYKVRESGTLFCSEHYQHLPTILKSHIIICHSEISFVICITSVTYLNGFIAITFMLIPHIDSNIYFIMPFFKLNLYIYGLKHT